MKKISPKYRYLVRDRLREIRTKLGLRRPKLAATVAAAPDVQPELVVPEPVTQAPATPELPVTYSRDIGFQDYLRRGWFNHETRELCPGFVINATDTVLDMGCGPGSFLKFCATYAAHAVGVDISPSCVQAAEQALKDAGVESFKVIQSDGNPLPLPSNLADKIVCTEVFEHVDDPRDAIRELVRVGKPGATYMLSVPGQLSEEILKEVAPAACFEKPNHIRIFSTESFRELVEQSGLEVQAHEFIGFYGAVWHAMIWKSGADYDIGSHPVLDRWAQTWETLMALPGGQACIAALDRALHKSQVIIARKPY